MALPMMKDGNTQEVDGAVRGRRGIQLLYVPLEIYFFLFFKEGGEKRETR